MGMTFTTVNGEVLQVENYNGVDVDQDIITKEVSGYFVTYDEEYRKEVTKEVYEALKEYYK